MTSPTAERTSTSGITQTEMIESLTGFDEIATVRHLDVDVYLDAERKPMGLMRALVFVFLRRPAGGSLTDADAKTAVLNMSAKQITDYFDEDPDEIDDDEPETSAGNDDSPADSEPRSLPLGAS